jgi:hypothetical protein
VIPKRAVLPVLFLTGAAIAGAQTGGGAGGGVVSRSGSFSASVSRPGSFSASVGFPGVPMPASAVTGMPYSGVREFEHSQTLADGTHVSQKNELQKIWRDADGRTRTERSMGPPWHTADMPTIIEITDPIAGYRYTLDQQRKIAHRVPIAPQPHLPLPRPTTSASSDATEKTGMTLTQQARVPRKMQRKSLGTKTIEGILVEGHRTIMTIPAGEVGNDRPISNVSESWFSPELNDIIELTSSDPRTGQTTTRLTNIDRNNPDPSLFLVPPDYEIVDEQGPFSIDYHR